MFTSKYTYLLLNLITIFFPLVLSFDKKVAFFKYWRHLATGMLVAGTLFIAWDVWFTDLGVWSFNSEYLVGINLLNLPIEEWLFFITVPYACVFILKCVEVYFKPKSGQWAKLVSLTMITLFVLASILNYDKIYTLITCALCALFLTIHLLIFDFEKMAGFLIAYALSAVPFFIVNGVLTANPVVIYNNAENVGFRLGSIPVEDFAYSFLLLLITVTFAEVSQELKVNSRLNHLKSLA
ncbi:MAG: lycopene cyclase domain-containing protein [Bacteroidetes bacterium]|nr:lycopene cyclase domain-containing protein [Bacteroidota bacterium]